MQYYIYLCVCLHRDCLVIDIMFYCMCCATFIFYYNTEHFGLVNSEQWNAKDMGLQAENCQRDEQRKPEQMKEK
jgi:hypothetical protein